MTNTERYKEAALLISDGSWDKAIEWLNRVMDGDKVLIGEGSDPLPAVIDQYAVVCAIGQVHEMRIMR